MKRIIFTVCTAIFLSLLQGNGYSQFTKVEQESISPGDALERLKSGNDKFVSSQTSGRDWAQEVKVSSKGQHPYAVLVSCMDSRVPTEVIFNEGIGDIFTNRVAGNVVNDDILGGLEYACAVVGSKLVLVLGHTDCGAVKGAIDDVELGNLTGLLHKIEPAVSGTKFEGSRTSSDKVFLELVTEENVRLAMNEIRKNSPILKKMEDEGKIMIIGGLYDVSTGKVTFYE